MKNNRLIKNRNNYSFFYEKKYYATTKIDK